MALDKWVPSRFAHLSDRLVTQNGILVMGGLSLLMLAASKGNVGVLVVFYSINVFITFTLSQLGMVRHGLEERSKRGRWFRPLLISGAGFVLFRNAGNEGLNVVYRRADGNIGWIDPSLTGKA